MTRDIIRIAENHLIKNDKAFGELVSKYGSCTLYKNKHDPFDTLVSSIVSQQMAAKTAKVIKKRLIKLCGGDNCFDMQSILSLSVEEIKSIGISYKKTEWIIGIAEACVSGELSFDDMEYLSDDKIIESLTSYKGVGAWTAEMFLIFAMGRLDIMSFKDFAIKKAVMQLYMLNEIPDDYALESISDKWRPYRSVAAWYLWRTLD